MEAELFLVGGRVAAEGPAQAWHGTVLSRRTDGVLRVRFDDGEVALLEPRLLVPRPPRATIPTIRRAAADGRVIPFRRRSILRRLAARRAARRSHRA
ncbi:hypothetical protein, partial [Tsukamurella soli]